MRFIVKLSEALRSRADPRPARSRRFRRRSAGSRTLFARRPSTGSHKDNITELKLIISESKKILLTDCGRRCKLTQTSTTTRTGVQRE